MLWYTLFLLRHLLELNHKQVDILLNVLIKAWPWSRVFVSHAQLEVLASHAVLDAFTCGLPHEQALAYLNRAQLRILMSPNSPFLKELVAYDVNNAIELEQSILTEDDRLYGRRQLVRIYRKAAELIVRWDKSLAWQYLVKALDLARGGVNMNEQVKKTQALLHELENQIGA